MNITLTLIMQMITFFIFVMLMMKFVWPKISEALEARRKQIADGLAAAERGQHDLEVAQHKVKELIREAKAQAAVIVEQANQRAHQIEEVARQEGLTLTDKMKSAAENDIQLQYQQAKTALQQQLAGLVVQGAEKVLQQEISAANNDLILKQLVDSI